MVRLYVQLAILFMLGFVRLCSAESDCLKEFDELKANEGSAIRTRRATYRAGLKAITKDGTDESAATAAKAYKEMYNKMGPVLVQYLDILLKEAATLQGKTGTPVKIAFKSDDGGLIYDLAKTMLERSDLPKNRYGTLKVDNLVLLNLTTAKLKELDGKPDGAVELSKLTSELHGSTTILAGVGGTREDAQGEIYFLANTMKNKVDLISHRLAILSQKPYDMKGARPNKGPTNVSGTILSIKGQDLVNGPVAQLFPAKESPQRQVVDSFIARMNGRSKADEPLPPPLKSGELPPFSQPDRRAAVDLARVVDFEKLGEGRIPTVREHFENYVTLAAQGGNPDPEKRPMVIPKK